MNGFFVGIGACKYASKHLKTGDAAQPKGCSAGFVPPSEWPHRLFMSMVNANGAHTDDISGEFLYIPEGKSSNTLLNMDFMDDLCTECYKRPEKRPFSWP